MSFEPIENYGVIGNMRSIALVGVNGSVDFLCYPNFDSPTVFAALLDDERGGWFLVQPQIKKRRGATQRSVDHKKTFTPIFFWGGGGGPRPLTPPLSRRGPTGRMTP